MSENAFQTQVNGQEVQQGDVNQIGATAGLADDHLLAEFLRLSPYNGATVDKAIIPSAYHGSPQPAVVQPSSRADGSISISPFRAVVGSRNAVNAPPGDISTDSDALANWRDIRSGVFVGSATNLAQPIVLTANASGNPRWDLVYASITPDAAGPSVQRRVKSPTAGNITVSTVPAYVYSPVTVAVITGTPGATPALPTLPADGAGVYNIPLAYVRVPNGFTSSTTVLSQDIRSTTKNGVNSVTDLAGDRAKPCNANNDANTAFNAGGNFPWNPASAGSRPAPWLPPDWVGGTTRIAQVDNLNGSSTWSHASLGIVDSSIDWRYRFSKITGVSTTVRKFATDPTGWSSAAPALPHDEDTVLTRISAAFNFHGDGINGGATGYTTLWSNSIGGQTAALLVEWATGNLLWFSTVTGSTGTSSRFVFWIDVTAQFPNP